MKRIIGISISVLLLVSLLMLPVLSAGTANNVQITFGKAEVAAGEFVEIPVYVSSEVTFNSFSLYELDYNENVLKFIGFTETAETADKSFFPDDAFMTNGDILLAFKKSESLNGQICKLRFSVKENAPFGSYPVTMSSLVKNSSTVISSGVTAGEIVVGHAMEHHEAVPATCVTDGNIEYWYCTFCEKKFADSTGTQAVDNVIIPSDSAEHKMQRYAAVDATCTVAGRCEYWQCIVCGSKFADEIGGQILESTATPLNPVNHVKLEYRAAVPATCTSGGTLEYWHCSKCGGNYGDAAGTQKLDSIIVAPEATAHLSLVYHEAVEATCISGGTLAYYHCKDCNNKYANEEGTQLLSDITVAPDPVEHPSLIHHEAVEAECTAGGIREYWNCKACGKNYSDALGTKELDNTSTNPDSANHPELEYHAAVPATCTSGGSVAYWHCSACGGNFADKAGKTQLSSITVPSSPSNHTKLSYHPAVITTCQTVGNLEYWYCGACGKYYASADCETAVSWEADLSISFNEAEHEHAGPFALVGAFAPTCSKDGHSGNKVCACSAIVDEGDTIPATSKHAWGAWTVISSVTVDSTTTSQVRRVCTADGCTAFEERTKETQTVSVKSEETADEAAVAIDVYKSNNDVEVVIENDALTKAVDDIAEKDTATEAAITIDVAAVAESDEAINAINQVAVPADAIKKIADAAADEDVSVSGLAVNLSAGSVAFDATALGVIAESSAGGEASAPADIKMDMSTISAAEGENIAEKIKETLGHHQKSVLAVMNDTQTILAAVTLEVSVGNEVISDWGQDNAETPDAGITLTVPYKARAGEDTNHLIVTYITNAGETEVIDEGVVYDAVNQQITFTVKHLSTYIISIETNAELPIITQPDNISVKVGEYITFTVEAESNDGEITSYEWYEAVTGTNTGGKLIGTGKNLTIKAEQAGEKQYYVIVTNTNEKATNNVTASCSSELITVTVTENVLPATYKISVNVKTAGVTLTLYRENGEQVDIRTDCPLGQHTFEGLSAGKYKLVVSKAKYVERTYPIEIKAPSN